MKVRASLLIIMMVLGGWGCSDQNTMEVDKEAKQHVGDPQPSDKGSVAAVSTSYQENVHYRMVDNIDSENLQAPFLVQYFWLGCPHCQSFEPILNNILADNPKLNILRKHAVLTPAWKNDAKIYYALEELNQLKHFDDLFELYRSKGKPTKDDIEGFLEQKAINVELFASTMQTSDNVKGQIAKSLNEMTANKISGVPQIVVNGKYLVIVAKDIKSIADYKALIDYLLSK